MSISEKFPLKYLINMYRFFKKIEKNLVLLKESDHFIENYNANNK